MRRCQPLRGWDMGVIHGRDSGLTSLADRGAHGLPAVTTRANCEADAQGYLHTSNISSLWLCLAEWQAGAVFCGHGGHAVCPCRQPWTLLPLRGEGAVQHEIGCVFLERQPLPSHFQVICHMPSSWYGDLPIPGLGNEQGGYPMEAEQYLEVWSPTNKLND